MCGLSPVVTPAGACLQTYREIYFNAYSTWDDNNNNKTKRGNAEEEGSGEREGKRRKGAIIYNIIVVIASEQPVHCLFFLFFCGVFLNLPPLRPSLLMNERV